MGEDKFLTFEYNGYIKKLVKDLEMLWIVTLNNGNKVYSDYYNPFCANISPWERLKIFCNDGDLYPIKIENLMFGAPHVVMAENKNGLDGVFIKRGASKDFLMESGEGTSYKQLIVGVLNDKDEIDITKFCWPFNALEKVKETRKLTPENAKLMFFKNGSEKRNREAVQIALNGPDV
jgi:hypothetical protein